MDLLLELGFLQLDLEPCVFVYFLNGKLNGVLGAEVDDLIGGGTAAFVNGVLRKLEERFNFRKKEYANQEGGARFGGRRGAPVGKLAGANSDGGLRQQPQAVDARRQGQQG